MSPHRTGYAAIFALLGLGFMSAAAQNLGAGWLLLWPACTCLVVAGAYAGAGSRVFGKSANGGQSWAALLVLLPYILVAWVTWRIARMLSNEPACSEVAPGLWIGRRPIAGEIPPGASLVVDLSCELWEPASVRSKRHYVCVPMLDASLCDRVMLDQLVRRISAAEGGVLIHCAQGHGRSAAVAAAVMINRGIVPDLAQAISRIQARRPRARVNSSQRRIIQRLFARRGDVAS